MKSRGPRVAAITAAIAICLGDVCLAGAGLPLKKITDIPLPGKSTRLDYQSLDPNRHLLFIAHLGDSEIIVVNTATRKVISTISNVSKVHGVLSVPELHTVYASATGSDEIVAVDERTLKITARIPGGVYPDSIAFDPRTRRLFVSDEFGNTETVIDTRSNKRSATIGLGGQAGNSQYDPASRHIFVNVQTLGMLVEIDPRTNAVLRRIALPGCQGNHGLLIDDRYRRAFVGCEDNATLVWLEMRAMRVMQTWTVGDDPDVLALDRDSNRVYVASESGVVSVFSDDVAVRRLAQGFLAPGAHTVAVDPVTHAVYFPLTTTTGPPLLRVMDPQ